MILIVAVRVFWDTLSTTWDAVARQYAARRSRVKVKYRTVSNQLLVCLRVAENTSQVRLDGSGIVSNERREGRGRRLAGSQRTVWGVCQTSSTEVHYCCHLPSTTEEVNVFAPVRLSVCLSVCLWSRLLKNVCMDLNEMLRVDRCRDMDELINFWARSGL